MKKITILMFALIAFWSCEKEEITVKEDLNSNYVESSNPLDLIVLENDRLVFESNEHFNNCLNEIAKMNDEELDLWETSLGFKSYRTYSNNIIKKEWEEFMAVSEAGGNVDELEDTELTEMPEILSALANTECEYQVGTKIFWLNKEYEYIIDNQNEELLTEIKKNKSAKSSFDGVHVHKVTKTYAKTNEALKDDKTKSDWHDSRYQYQFKFENHEYKMVFECCVWDYNGRNGYYEVRNKFEYKKGSSWKHAGQIVTRKTNITVSILDSHIVGWESDYHNRTVTSSSDLIVAGRGVQNSIGYFIDAINVSGTMYAYTNHGGSWSRTFSMTRRGELWSKEF